MTGWTISIGPFKFGTGCSKGGGIPNFWAEPKFNFGVTKDGWDAHVGLSDVRDGVELACSAGYTQHFEGKGNSLVEFLESIKTTGCPAIGDEKHAAEFEKAMTDLIAAYPHLLATILKIVHVDISGSYVEGVVEFNLTLGVSGKVAAGAWTDADGYRMYGAAGKIACVGELKYGVFVGWKDHGENRLNNFKLLIGGPCFLVKVYVDKTHHDKEEKEPHHGNWKHVGDEGYVIDHD